MRIGVRELRQNASRYLALVESGEVVEVSSRGRVIARLVPVDGDSWEQMVASGEVLLPERDDLLSLEPRDYSVDASAELQRAREDRL